MLRPVVFVGCGGSGVRTVHKIREELERQLRERRYTGRFPESWQFLTIDVPAVQQSTADAVGAIPYINLADSTTKYKGADSADASMMGVGDRRKDYLQWRPNPETVHVNLAIGAGQYRAVGRVAAAYKGLDTVGSRVQTAANKCLDDSVTLAEVCRAFDIDVQPGANSPTPYVILISSLGGGAGSGIFLDVADTIRLSAEGATPWLQSGLIGVLYDPSVFDMGLEDVARRGIPGNTLAAVSELVAGQWCPWGVSPSLTGAAGVLGTYAGLEYAFLVGSSNGEVAMSSPDEVYSATARALAAWTLDPSISSKMDEITLGNWAAEDANSSLKVHLSDGHSARMPFSALGYARVDLGRRRFAIYAEERLAREAVTSIATKHETEAVKSGRVTPEDAAAQRVREQDYRLVEEFLNSCGLNEHSDAVPPQAGAKRVDNNQVLDAIRDKEFLDEECESKSTAVLNLVRDPKNRLGQFEGATGPKGPLGGWAEMVKARHERRAVEWALNVQDLVLEKTLRLIGDEGLLVTRKVLETVIVKVGESFPSELIAEKERGEIKAAQDRWRDQRKWKDWSNTKRDFEPKAKTYMKSLLDAYYWGEVESDLRDVVAPLLKDMAENFLTPLCRAVDRAAQVVSAEMQTRDFGDLSSSATVASSLLPAKTELLMESPADYSKRFDEQVRASAGTVESCLAQIVDGRLVSDVSADQLSAELRPWSKRNLWVPDLASSASFREDKQTRAVAEFELEMGVAAMRRRAQHWLSADLTRPIGRYLATTLAEYLEDGQLAEPARKKRVEDFCNLLKEAFRKSSPLTDVHWGWTANRFGVQRDGGTIRYMSRIPLAPPAPQALGATASASSQIGREISTALQTDEVSGYFSPGSSTHVEVFAMLRPLPPSAFQSLAKPIVESKSHFDTRRPVTWAGDDFWLNRRARPFLETVPLMPAVRLTLARGWVTGVLTGRLKFGETSVERRVVDLTKPIAVSSGDNRSLQFVHPPIGALSGSIPADFRKVAAFQLVLNSVLFAEFAAAQNGNTEALDAIVEVLKLGTSAGDGTPMSNYGAGLHPELERFVRELPEKDGTSRHEQLATSLKSAMTNLAAELHEWKPNESGWSDYPPHLAVTNLYMAALESLVVALEEAAHASRPRVPEEGDEINVLG